MVYKTPEGSGCTPPECSGFKVLINVISEILESVARKIPFGAVYKIWIDRSDNCPSEWYMNYQRAETLKYRNVGSVKPW